MPPKKMLKLDDAVDSVYEDSSEDLHPSYPTILTENIGKDIETVNYLWKVRYEVVRDNGSLGIEVFVDFKSRYTFKDKVSMMITAKVKGKKIVKEFDLEKRNETKLKLDLIEIGADIIDNKDIKITCEIVVSQVEYNAEFVGTTATVNSANRPHDAILLVGDKKYYVLKKYTSTWSEYFNELFHGDSADKEKKEFKIEDVDAEEFSELLHIIYPSLNVEIEAYNVQYILKLAARFKMPSVVSMCGTYLSDFDKLPSLSLMERLALSDEHNISHLQVACLKNLHAKSAVEQQAFRDENREQLKDLSEGTMKNFM